MPEPRLDGIPRFARRLGLAALVATAAWWPLRAPWGEAFRTLAGALLAAAGWGRVTLHAAPAGSRWADDTLVSIAGQAEGVSFPIGSLRFSYIPLAVFLCLAFAAGQWRSPRKGFLVAGLAGVAAYGVASLAVTIARTTLLEPGLGFRPPAVVATLVELTYRTLVNPPAFEYVVPAFIWLASSAASAATPARSRG